MASEETPFIHSRDTTLVGSPTVIPPRASPTPSNMSHPFIHADELETNSEAFLSFYLDAEPDPSQLREPYKPLLEYLKHCSLVRHFKRRMRDIVLMVVEIGKYLFPSTYLLNQDIKKKVMVYAEEIHFRLEQVVEYLKRRMLELRETVRHLPSPISVDRAELESTTLRWTEIMDSIHKPTGREASVFRELSGIYSTHVYHPFLQLHRTDPRHNMWELEPQLTPIALLIRENAWLSERVDDVSRGIREEYEATMVEQPHSDQGTETSLPDEVEKSKLSKQHHSPSKSEPVVIAEKPLISPLLPRTRENTF
ncbi:hypothetical protein AAFC00_006113 [Neodothiora populina]|uniref:Uncharacterized protein n=1 Tax=Neodothiora populina TaxID=2781224 RepID=A0ABR3P441_9PEZI